MKDKEEFFNLLTEIDGQDFAEYKQLIGDFDFSRFVVRIHQVDPAQENASTLFVIRVPQYVAGIPAHLYNTPVRRTALEDYLTRRFASESEAVASFDEEGIARRRVEIAGPGQKILPRASLVVTEEHVEARVYVNLPARQRRILGDSAKDVFFEDLPRIVNHSLIYCNLDEAEVEEFVNLMEDADQIRQVLPTRGWVSFVGEGSMLSRLGDTDEPDYERMDSLVVPEELLVDVEVPNQELIRGFGIPTGITVILGDDYSGRAELVRALAAGIYNHIPGDGREAVITVPDAVHIAAERDRSVQRANISAFIEGALDGVEPTRFTSGHADACTAQAAATIEALEVGAHVLIFDESDSSPAFLVRDSRLEKVLSGNDHVITPLCARARQIADELGVSLIIGGTALVAEFIPVADTVLRVRNFTVDDITSDAKALAVKGITAGENVADLSGIVEHSRWIIPSSIDPSSGRFDTNISASDVKTLVFGRSVVDLSAVSQLADVYQTATIGLILAYAKTRYMEEGRPIREVLDLVDRDLSTEGLECLTRDLRGDLARPRRYEIAAALNRLQTLRVAPPPD